MANSHLLSKTSKAALFEGCLGVFIMGAVPVLIKSTSANPWTIGIVRLVVAGLCILIFFKKSRMLKALTLSDWGFLVLIGGAFGFHWITYFWSIKLSSPSYASIAVSSYGLYLTILGYFFFNTKPSWIHFGALGCAILGCWMVVPDFSLNNSISFGFFCGLISALFYAFLPILHKKSSHLNFEIRSLFQYGFALAVFLVFFPLSEWNLSNRDWIILMALAIFCTFISHTLWLRATSALPTTTSSLIYYLYVPTAMLLSFIFLDETIHFSMLFGASLIIFGSFIGIHQQWRQKKST